MTEGQKNWDRSRTLAEACRYAGRGVVYSIKADRNARFQLVVMVIVLVSAVWLRLPWADLAMVVLVSALVLSLEMVNTAVEEIANLVQPELHERVRNLKDAAAGAVLVASLAAVVVGLLLLGRPLVALVFG